MLLVQLLVFALYLLTLGLRLWHTLVNAAWPSGLGGRGPSPSQRFALLAFQLLALKHKARAPFSRAPVMGLRSQRRLALLVSACGPVRVCV